MNENYQKSKEQLFSELSSGENGLSSTQAKKNTEKFGKNELVEEKAKNPVVIFFEQFKDFLVIILVIAAIVSAVLGYIESTIVILAVITMNAVIGTVQTLSAAKSLNSLKKLSAPTAKVIRDGQTVMLP